MFDAEAIRKQVIRLMESEAPSLRRKALAQALGIASGDYGQFRTLLRQMREAGEIARARGGKLSLSGRRADPNLLTGRLEVKPQGYGFVLAEEAQGSDLFVPKGELGGALTGDLVQVRLRRGKFGRRHGRVVKVLERARTCLVGTLRRRPDRWRANLMSAEAYLVPDAKGVPEIRIPAGEDHGAEEGDKVVCELLEHDASPTSVSRRSVPPAARVVRLLGRAGQREVEVAAILENHALRQQFPPEVQEEARRLPLAVAEEDRQGRADYSRHFVVTIDPPEAKDHDDGVSLTRQDGDWLLHVHIADVSHYVREGTEIDHEARRRGTSVYLPGRVIPMLPFELSHELCSLKESCLRLTKTVTLRYGSEGQLKESRLERSCIRPARRLSYPQVREIIAGRRVAECGEAVFRQLEEMKELGALLRRARLAAGSLELDFPDINVILEPHTGAVARIEKEKHDWTHQLIEEFMLAANRAVADWLVRREVAGLFRVHDQPEREKLDQFAEFCRELGLPLQPPYDHRKLQKVLDAVRGRPLQQPVHLMLLTSLKQAVYSAQCRGHYALLFDRYLHFTSPIRRYPDLVVHRQLDKHFPAGQPALPWTGPKTPGLREAHQRDTAAFVPLATHCSLTERAAEAVEKEVKQFLQMEYLQQHLQESYPGTITGVRPFGFFVELDSCFLEGLVKIASLTDDFYEYDEKRQMLVGLKKRRRFRLGDRVAVRVIRVELTTKEVELLPLPGPG